ncbi:MAG: universal stress protein [Deltaproteobacteria bacterium]|nr:universal stress protein [Deltaproteobacteria bacterium]MBW2661726.1 universal stress protein [Deltaproteobacteria bacterium]
MDKKILVAFDDSDNAMRAVEYVAKNFATDNKITLLNIVQDTAALCDMNSPELTPYFKSQQKSFCTLEEKKKDLVDSALQKARLFLIDAGYKKGNVTIKAKRKKKGVARDIVKEGQSGYHTIIIGRRGQSGIAEFILGSVSQKVLQLVKDISVLLVN